MPARESSKWRFGQEIRSIRSVKAINPLWAAETPMPQGQTEEEIALLRAEAANVLNQDHQEVWREKTGHRGPRLPRIPSARCSVCWRGIRAWSSRCGSGSARMSTFIKLNAKAPSEGDVWQWHQDYGTWARDDGMPELRAMNIAVFLDAVMAINGPLFLIRKSHRADVLNPGHDKLTSSYPLWTLDNETVTRLVD
jgi:ectoine hydroxylase